MRTLAVFGSVARGESRAGSDVDVLVDLERLTFDDFMGLKLDLERILGAPVGLVTRTGLRPRLRAIVEHEAVNVASRDPRLYLEDILEGCRRIREHTAGMSFQQFQADARTRDAVLRNLEVIISRRTRRMSCGSLRSTGAAAHEVDDRE